MVFKRNIDTNKLEVQRKAGAWNDGLYDSPGLQRAAQGLIVLTLSL